MIDQRIDAEVGMTVTVKGIELSSSFPQNSRTIYNIVGETNGKTVYGFNHAGSVQGWKDQFVVNFRDLQYDDLDLVAFVNDTQIGRGHLNINEVMRSPSSQSDIKIQLRNNENNVVGYLPVHFHRYMKQQVVGGLKPPIVTLRTNPYDDTPSTNTNIINSKLGLQQVAAQKRNLFSCLDVGSGWQFMPNNFQTKTRQVYRPITGTGNVMTRSAYNRQQGGMVQSTTVPIGTGNIPINQEVYGSRVTGGTPIFQETRVSRVGTINADPYYDNQIIRPNSIVDRRTTIQTTTNQPIIYQNEIPGARYTTIQPANSIQSVQML